jgi:guanine deaminase
MKEKEIQFMKMAIDLSLQGMRENKGGPFGAIVVKDGVVIGKGNNSVASTMDPTAHAEVVAIRDACKTLNSFQLDGCEIYTSCEPCPMCLGAIYWARPSKVFYANTREHAAAIGFDDSFIYEEVKTEIPLRKIPMVQIGQDLALKVFEEWKNKPDKTEY